MTSQKIRVNIVSESDISVQGHGVHTAYAEMAQAFDSHPDVDLVKGEFGRQVDCDIVHLHTVGPRVYKKLIQKDVKKVISAHIVPDSFVGSLAGARFWKGLAGIYLKFIYNRADLLVAVSPATATELERMKVKSPVVVIENSIDTSRYRRKSEDQRIRIRTELGIPQDAFVVIGAGQVQPRKRVDRFIEAARSLPGVEFIWVGGIPFGRAAASYRAMQELMEGGTSNMHFPGIVPLDSMAAYYQAADLFWLPSEQETFGLVVIEAAASGLPIVLRDIPDYQETFADYALTLDDASDTETIDLLSKDKKMYEEYMVKSRRLASRFDSRRATDILVSHYRRLLEYRHAGGVVE